MMQLSDFGSVGLSNLECVQNHEDDGPFPHHTSTESLQWPEEIRRLKDEVDAYSADVGTFGRRSLAEVDLRPAYLGKSFCLWYST